MGSSNLVMRLMFSGFVRFISSAFDRWILEMRSPASVSALSAVDASSYWSAKWQVS